jgi:hypothetical protein
MASAIGGDRVAPDLARLTVKILMLITMRWRFPSGEVVLLTCSQQMLGAVDSLNQFARRASGIAIRWGTRHHTHDRSSAAFTTNIAESNFRYTEGLDFAPKLTG